MIFQESWDDYSLYFHRGGQVRDGIKIGEVWRLFSIGVSSPPILEFKYTGEVVAHDFDYVTETVVMWKHSSVGVQFDGVTREITVANIDIVENVLTGLVDHFKSLSNTVDYW